MNKFLDRLLIILFYLNLIVLLFGSLICFDLVKDTLKVIYNL